MPEIVGDFDGENQMSTAIEVRNLKKYFPTPRGMLHAVDDVSFYIEKGKTIGVVGESGCGKSTLGRTIIHLLEPTGGQILFNGEDISNPSKKELRVLRNKMQIIFQDPYSSLDPRICVEDAIMEPLIVAGMKKPERIEKAEKLMKMCGIDERLRRSYPHELDGGRRQRVVIARALSLDPEFVVCDEPVSALDVSIQAQVLNLLHDLQKEHGFTYMFVTHDMSVVRHISDDIIVMYLGQVVEKAPSKELFAKPMHPYTKALLSAIPSVDIHNPAKREILKGELTSPINPKPGCRFAARCQFVCEKCHQKQILTQISDNHFVSCCRMQDGEL